MLIEIMGDLPVDSNITSFLQIFILVLTPCNRFLKIYFLYIGFSRVHSLIIHIQAREGSCLDGAQQNISASRFLIFLVLKYRFLLHWNLS